MIKLLFVAAAVMLLPRAAIAQFSADDWSVADVSRALETEAGLREVEVRILETSTYSPRSARADSLIDVLTAHATNNLNPKVRLYSALYLVAFSENGNALATAQAIRLAETDRQQVRAVLLQEAHRLQSSGTTISWLRREATAPTDEAQLAVMALAQIGEAGRSVLRQLSQSGQVRNSKAQSTLQWLATRSFELPSETGRPPRRN